MVDVASNETSKQYINPEDAAALLSAEGRIARFLKGYEARSQQEEMLRAVVDAFNHRQVALIEAGTGTGKSLGYLIPALLAAQLHGSRTVISTNTINLQEQLLHKDIPFLMNALGLDLKVRLVKGMGNYVCLRKLEEATELSGRLNDQEAEQLASIEEWSKQTADGSRASLPFLPQRTVWDLAGAEPDLCTWHRCAHFKNCFFANARQEAADAHILVVNHHLLFADIVRRAQDENYSEQAVLPYYDHLILDEAHNIEDIAAEYFGSRATRVEASRLMARLASEKTGKLTELRKRLPSYFKGSKQELPEELKPTTARLEVDLPQKRKILIKHFGDLFNAYADWLYLLQQSATDGESDDEFSKIRLRPHHLKSTQWTQVLLPTTEHLYESLQEFVTSVQQVLIELRKPSAKEFWEQHATLIHDIQALSGRLHQLNQTIKAMVSPEFPQDRVRWVEGSSSQMGNNVHLMNASLDLSAALQEHLFSRFRSITLCSATLTTHNKFSFLCRRLGLDKPPHDGKQVCEYIFDSPFDYTRQALFVCPEDMPLPNENSFQKAATEEIWHAIQASKGSALVLFTSHRMMLQTYQQLEQRCSEGRFPLLKQGDSARHQLLQTFRKTPRAVLFATYSFWEGVDISGDALRCVIIVKLPFKVPSEPLMQARCELLASQGNDAFRDYSLPLAIIKFKQGFGRLIRSRSDSGCIVCLDARLVKKNYGQIFLRSLPACQRCVASTTHVRQALNTFFHQRRSFTQV